ncbi:MAG: hypothetical protein MJA29_08945 [Candidatus Omnitrophica bacterium]|nr:hypothetical protein [Candidatus Omnitrophota bacterium]
MPPDKLFAAPDERAGTVRKRLPLWGKYPGAQAVCASKNALNGRIEAYFPACFPLPGCRRTGKRGEITAQVRKELHGAVKKNST